jgi:hypothetical protein
MILNTHRNLQFIKVSHATNVLSDRLSEFAINAQFVIIMMCAQIVNKKGVTSITLRR